MVLRMGTRRTVLTGIAAIAACGLPGFLVAALAPSLKEDLGLEAGALGLAFAVFWGTGAVTSSPGGRLAERLGWVSSLRLAAVVVAACCALIGLVADSPAALIGLLAVAGLANSLALPAVSLLFSDRVGHESQGRAFGISQSGAPAAALLAGLALPAIALQLGWRWAFGAAALVALAVAACAAGGATRHERPAAARAGRARLSPGLVVLTLAAALGTTAAGAGNGFLVVSAVDAGFGERAAGLLLAGASVTAVLARMGLGLVSDRPGTHRFLITTLMLTAGSVGFGLLALESRTAFFLGTLLALGAGWGWLGLFLHGVVGLYREAPGAATGVAQTGLLAGGCAGPLLFGLVAERASLDLAWLLIAAIGASAALAMLVGRHLVRLAGRPAAAAF
jgi:MFS family permease